MKLYYKIGLIGAVINIIIGALSVFLSQLSHEISFFGVYNYSQTIVINMVFSVIAILGVILSTNKKDIGLTTMMVISIAGILAYPGIFIIGYIIIMVGVVTELLYKK